MLLIIFSRIGLVFSTRISQNLIAYFFQNRSHIILRDSIICCIFVSRYMHIIHFNNLKLNNLKCIKKQKL